MTAAEGPRRWGSSAQPAEVDAGGFSWDDATWELVWERTLNQVERHNIAMAVVRRRPSAGVLEWRVAQELARRWGRHAASLSRVYLLWTVFWGAIAWNTVQVRGVSSAGLPLSCAAIGVVAIAACVLFRLRMGRTQAALRATPPAS